jgi:hypothetical protein
LWRGHQGQCAKYHHSNFYGWRTYQGCHIPELWNYLSLLPSYILYSLIGGTVGASTLILM